LIYLQIDTSSVDPTNNSKLGVIHGTSASEPRDIIDGYASLLDGQIPLAYVLYRYNTSGDIYPLISETAMGGNPDPRFGYELPIVDLTLLPSGACLGFTIDVSELMTSTYYESGDNIDIFDSKTRPIRRTIVSSIFNSLTKTVQIQVNSSFSEISLSRNAKARSSKHISIIEDARPFIGIG
jgi:hypothetical protein